MNASEKLNLFWFVAAVAIGLVVGGMFDSSGIAIATAIAVLFAAASLGGIRD